MTESDKKTHGRKRRAAKLAAGTAAAAAITLGSLFNAADELIGDSAEESPRAAETAVVAVEESAAQPQSIIDRLRAFFLGQNAFVRGAVLLPLWAVGKALLSLLSLAWAALSPFAGLLLGVLANALLLFALFAFVYKMLFPGAKLSDLFKKKRWLWLLVAALLLAIADAALARHLPDYRAVSLFIKLFCGFVALTTLCFRIFGPKTAQE